MNKLISQVHQFIIQHNLFQQKEHIVIGLSGGPDSLFLMHLLKHLQQEFSFILTAAHLDHEWRNDSADDTLFCKQVAEKLQINFVTKKASELPKKFKDLGSKEALGRSMRRYFLEQTLSELEANKIALGHHAQDQEETFFIHLIRGTTLTGLSGMKPLSKKYARPLLRTRKQDIIQWLNDHDVSYLIDPSNEQPHFLRNRIRQQVIPILNQVDPRFEKNFLYTIDNLQQTDEFLADLTRKIFNNICIMDNNYYWLSIPELKALPEIMQHRLLMYWLVEEHASFTPTKKFLAEIKRFLYSSQQTRHDIHTHWAIIKKNNRARIVHI